MGELEVIFAELGLSQYLEAFVEQGFDTWDIILDITESDFDALGVKLGHRRKLQRRIANSRGVSTERSLASPKRRAASVDDNVESVKETSGKSDAKDGTSVTGKRKYRRHPKPDDNAPERPPSAYVIFSNKMREDLKGRHLSFTEIAKLVGENWQNLSSGEKEPYEAQAFSAKEKYNAELVEYKKTDAFKRYSEYLVGFKAKHSNQQSGTASKPSEGAMPYSKLTDSASNLVKRPKLDGNHVSNSSSGTANSYTSQNDHGVDRMRTGSIGSWHQAVGEYPPASAVPHTPGLITGNGHGHALAHHPTQASRGGPMPGASLPGYRDIVINSTQQQTLAWRDGTSASSPVSTTHTLQRPSAPSHSQSPLESPVYHGIPLQHPSHRGSVPPPPLLRTESTVASTDSQNSSYYGPRTPLEPSLDRSGAVPALYPTKLPAMHEAQLPRIRQSSLSPQGSVSNSYDASASAAAMDYSHNNPRRAFLPPLVHSVQAPGAHSPHGASSMHEEFLDPVSALLKAGEIVDSGSRHRANMS